MHAAVPASPMVLICSHTASGRIDPTAPCSPPMVPRTAAESESIVRTTSAPSAASNGLSASRTPSAASGSAFSRDRFQARTSIPDAAMLRAIGRPIVPPAPRTATVKPLDTLDAGLAAGGVAAGHEQLERAPGLVERVLELLASDRRV